VGPRAGLDDVEKIQLGIELRTVVVQPGSYSLRINWYSGGWSQLSQLGTAATNRPIVPAKGDYNGEFG
jgi:hypothetical protein